MATYTSADLVKGAQSLLKQHLPRLATLMQWAAGQIDAADLWKATAQGQLDSQAATITQLQGQATDTAAQVAELQSDNAELTKWKTDMLAQWAQESLICDQLQAQIKDLTAQLAAATISPLSLVMIDTHLYGFSSVDASQAFYDANSGQPKQMFKVTNFQMDPPEGTT